MKQHWKRNLTVLTVVLFVAAAVYFNWSYNQQFGAADADMVMAEDDAMEKAGVKPEQASEKETESKEPEAPVSDYFAQARLTRQQSRDEALNLLEAASSADGASQETIDSAMTAIAAMASDSMTETRIENLLLAKGLRGLYHRRQHLCGCPITGRRAYGSAGGGHHGCNHLGHGVCCCTTEGG